MEAQNSIQNTNEFCSFTAWQIKSNLAETYFFGNMNIWNLDNKAWPRLNLFRSANGTFRVIQAGDYAPVLTTGIHILIHQKYAGVFEELHGQVTLKRAMIYDQALDTENHEYFELDVINAISHDTINLHDGGGKKIWHDRDYIFISSALKDELITVDIEGALSFTQGYSHFGG